MGIKIDVQDWSKAIDYFLSLDKRTHIDREMYALEAALNLKGIGTCFSCSGHPDDFPAFPYVLICSQKALTGLIPEYIELMSNSPISDKALVYRRSIMEIHAELGQNLLQLLDGFYRDRQATGIGSRLVIQTRGFCRFMLVNQGSIVGLATSGYLQEFASFTEYLKGVI